MRRSCNNQGLIPLMVATKRSDKSLVKQLLEAKAILEAKDNKGKSALDYAQERAALPLHKRPFRAKSIVTLLQSYQPKKEAKQAKE